MKAFRFYIVGSEESIIESCLILAADDAKLNSTVSLSDFNAFGAYEQPVAQLRHVLKNFVHSLMSQNLFLVFFLFEFANVIREERVDALLE